MTPETEPDLIRAQHLNEVREAFEQGIKTPEEISEHLYLPLWNVRRAMAAMGVLQFECNPKPETKTRKRNTP